jgi:hypothetical protein
MKLKNIPFSRKEGVTKKLAILTVNFHLKRFIAFYRRSGGRRFTINGRVGLPFNGSQKQCIVHFILTEALRSALPL